MEFKRRENFRPTDKKLILVGSKNPVKIACTEDAFIRAFNSAFLVEGINAPSGIPARLCLESRSSAWAIAFTLSWLSSWRVACLGN
jgi:hypothetical protein